MPNHKFGLRLWYVVLATQRCWSYDNELHRIGLSYSHIEKVLLHQKEQKFVDENSYWRWCHGHTHTTLTNILKRHCKQIWDNQQKKNSYTFSDGEVRFNPTDLHAANYHIMGLDLRNVDEVENKLKQAEVDFSIPTIFLAECVLVYIETNYCTNLLKWLSGHFSSAVFVNYEQVSWYWVMWCSWIFFIEKYTYLILLRWIWMTDLEMLCLVTCVLEAVVWLASMPVSR